MGNFISHEDNETQLPDSQQEIITYLLYGVSSLSAISALFIMLTYISFPSARSFGTSLVFWLSVADFFTSISWFPWGQTNTLCIIQASFLQIFETASFFWSLSIAITLFLVFFIEFDEDSFSKRLYPIFHVLNWGYPLLTALICLFFHKFGYAGAWCWIANGTDYFRLLLYGPLILIFFFIIISVILIRIKLRFISSEFKTALNRKLTFYLLAYCVSQLPAVVNRIQNYAYPGNPIFVLFIFQAIFQPSQGFFNCLVYGINEQQFLLPYQGIISKIKNLKFCFCFNSNEKQNQKTIEEVSILNYGYYDESDNSDKEEESMGTLFVSEYYSDRVK